MTERERLIDMLAHIGNMRIMRHGLGECADYMLANGVIAPPCKVGDTVYSYSADFGVVLPYLVVTFQIGFMGKTQNYISYEANCHDPETDDLLDGLDFDIGDIDKTVFLTREDAEKALEDMK